MIYNGMNKDKEKLRSCPFCGSENVETILINKGTRVICTDCDSHGSKDSDKDKAIQKWNKRANIGAVTSTVKLKK